MGWKSRGVAQIFAKIPRGGGEGPGGQGFQDKISEGVFLSLISIPSNYLILIAITGRRRCGRIKIKISRNRTKRGRKVIAVSRSFMSVPVNRFIRDKIGSENRTSVGIGSGINKICRRVVIAGPKP